MDVWGILEGRFSRERKKTVARKGTNLAAPAVSVVLPRERRSQGKFGAPVGPIRAHKKAAQAASGHVRALAAFIVGAGATATNTNIGRIIQIRGQRIKQAVQKARTVPGRL